MRNLFTLLLGVAALSLAACSTGTLPPPQASLSGIQAVRKSDLPPLRVGVFTAAPGKPSRMDRSITVRAGTQPAPEGGYAKYLGDTIAAQLQGAGKLDPASAFVISGVVTDTHVDSTMPMATARLKARFKVERDGRTVYEKELSAEDTWKSEFIGAVAIPDAFNHYTALFGKLAEALVTDPEFIQAVR